MRVLPATLGSHGDVLAFVGLGRAFRDHGHDVVLFANPVFRAFAEDVGLRFVPCATVHLAPSAFRSSVDPARLAPRLGAGTAHRPPERPRAGSSEP